VNTRRTRILVVTDKPDPDARLIRLISQRAERGQVQLRVVVPNPARAELRLLHPERHDKADEAEHVLHKALPELELTAGGPVIGSVSVRNDPMDAIEEILFSEPIDEIILAVASHGFSTRFHQDLPHRLQHFGIPLTVLPPSPAPAS
jgi:hypothetical protein